MPRRVNRTRDTTKMKRQLCLLVVLRASATTVVDMDTSQGIAAIRRRRTRTNTETTRTTRAAGTKTMIGSLFHTSAITARKKGTWPRIVSRISMMKNKEARAHMQCKTRITTKSVS
jgi:hypothetical protein